MEKTLQKKKSKIAFPHVGVLMCIIVLITCLATYIVPAGVYDRSETGAIDPTSFHYGNL